MNKNLLHSLLLILLCWVVLGLLASCTCFGSYNDDLSITPSYSKSQEAPPVLPSQIQMEKNETENDSSIGTEESETNGRENDLFIGIEELELEITDDTAKELCVLISNLPNNSGHVGRDAVISDIVVQGEDITYYKEHVYSNHRINGYALLRIQVSPEMDAVVFQAAGDLVLFRSSQAYPSLWALYLYKQNELMTIEKAWELGVVNSEQICEIAKVDPKYGISVLTKAEAEAGGYSWTNHEK